MVATNKGAFASIFDRLRRVKDGAGALLEPAPTLRMMPGLDAVYSAADEEIRITVDVSGAGGVPATRKILTPDGSGLEVDGGVEASLAADVTLQVITGRNISIVDNVVGFDYDIAEENDPQTVPLRGTSGELQAMWLSTGPGGAVYRSGTLILPSGDSYEFRNSSNAAILALSWVNTSGGITSLSTEQPHLVFNALTDIHFQVGGVDKAILSSTVLDMQGIGNIADYFAVDDTAIATIGILRGLATSTLVAFRKTGDAANIKALSSLGDNRVTLGDDTEGEGVTIDAPSGKNILLDVAGSTKATLAAASLDLAPGVELTFNGSSARMTKLDGIEAGADVTNASVAGSYTAANGADWDGNPPTTIAAALDRLANLVAPVP